MEHVAKKLDDMQAFIQPLNVNSLRGRMLRLKSTKHADKEILMVYGHHSSIERMYGLAEVFQDYGNVTMPDLPGFGGMDSYHRIGVKPSIDTLADYLATFVKLKYRKKKVTIVAMSLGFALATRMLQRYPELQKKVTLLVSLVGFTRADDTILPKKMMYTYRALAHVFRRRVASMLFYNLILHPTVIRTFYAKTPNARKKFDHLSREDKRRALDFEVVLWRDNDVRTYMDMILEMMNLDNCKKQIKVPVHHVGVDGDQYFDNAVVEQHMRVIFSDYSQSMAVLPNHAPSIVATKEEAAPFVPKKLKKVLLESLGQKK
jgi:pimeloyl-ACP methyl ester carboxylesterase